MLCSSSDKNHRIKKRTKCIASEEIQTGNSMRRKISKALEKWKSDPGRMPLIVNGARQVGKTYIIRQFGREHYEQMLYLNLEIEEQLCMR